MDKRWNSKNKFIKVTIGTEKQKLTIQFLIMNNFFNYSQVIPL